MGDPEPSRVFLNRPKQEGLWVRMVFLDGEVMDGILPNNLLTWEAGRNYRDAARAGFQ